MLPILHLNGYKIANPTVLARIGREELEQLLRGYGYHPHFVEGDDPEKMHPLMAATLDKVVAEIKKIQHDARGKGHRERPHWPMIVFTTPRAGPGPKSSMVCRSRGRIARTRCRYPNRDASRALKALGKLDAQLSARRAFR